MPRLSEIEKEELLAFARSPVVRSDMRHVAAHRHNPVIADGRVDMDRLLDFLNDFNSFINHRPKPRRPMIDRDMRL